MVLLIGCGSDISKNSDKEVGKDEITKEVLIKIINAKKDKHYYLQISTNSKREANIVPKLQQIITNNKNEAKVKLNPNITYSIIISESNVNDMKNFMSEKSKGAKLTGPVLKKIEYKPKKNNKNVLKIYIDE